MMRLLARLRSDNRGVSAVEFAMIAPVLITFYFGLAELTQAMMVERRTNHAIAAVGDLVTQTSSLTNAELDDIYTIAEAIMKPFPADGLQMRVTSVSQNGAGVKTVDWSDGDGMTPLLLAPTMPNGLVANNQSVVIAEISYTYESAVKFIVPDGITFTKTYYFRPRKSDKVTKT